MKRIIIMGPPGTGKTTLSQKLGKALNLTILHLDSLHFEAGWVLRERSEVREDIKKFIDRNDRWVMDGNWSHSLPMRLERADTIIYLDYGLEVSRGGITERNKRYRGRRRPDVPQCIERVDDDFLEYVDTFEEMRGRSLKDRIRSIGGIEVHIFRSREECDLFIEGVMK